MKKITVVVTYMNRRITVRSFEGKNARFDMDEFSFQMSERRDVRRIDQLR